MSDNEEIRYVSDRTRPNAGRIYDYMLGGDYNFPVDQEVADKILENVPSIQNSAKIIRWFLGNAIDRVLTMGFTQFLDFASGLPTVDHIHIRIPEDVKKHIKIVYSDIDPITVQIGREIIGTNPSIKFLECDCRKPEILLESDSVKNFFNTNQKIAIGLSGILYFLSDDEIKYTIKTLYDWAPRGSILYFCDLDSEAMKDKPEFQANLQYYKNINQPIFLRFKKDIKNLIQPWKIKEPGLQSLDKWLDLEQLNLSEDFIKETGMTMYGGFLEK